jgi:hypothetical protein
VDSTKSQKSNCRKSKGLVQTATAVTANGMTITREAGITVKQASMVAAVILALNLNNVNLAKAMADEIEQTGASIFDFEIDTSGIGNSVKQGLVAFAWQTGNEAALLWISQKALDDNAWKNIPFLRTLPNWLEQFDEGSVECRLATKVIRLLADKITKKVAANTHFVDGAEQSWGHLPVRTRNLFSTCLAINVSQIERTGLEAEIAAPAAGAANAVVLTTRRL